MKREFLESLGLEKEAIDKILDENSRDIGREKQKTEQANADLKAVQEQLAQRVKDLEELKKTAGNAEEATKKLEELQGKYSAETEALKAQLADRDYSDAISRTIGEKGVKFSSKSAERAFTAALKEKALALKDGALEGFDDFLKAQKEADPDAFAPDKAPPKFVAPVGQGGPPADNNKGAAYAKAFNAQYAAQTKKE